MLRDRYPSCLSVTFVYCGQTVEWIKMSLGTEVDLGPGDIVLDADPASPQGKGHNSIPTFQPMSIVAKRSPISATAELLFTDRMPFLSPRQQQHRGNLKRLTSTRKSDELAVSFLDSPTDNWAKELCILYTGWQCCAVEITTCMRASFKRLYTRFTELVYFQWHTFNVLIAKPIAWCNVC